MLPVMRCGYIPWLVLLFFCYLNATGLGQSVTVRVINTKGEPFRNKQVYISGLSGQKGSKHEEQLKLTKKPIRADLNLMTDNRGETTFDLPKPLPAYVYIRPVFSERVWDCTCFVALRTDELLQKGIVISSAEHKKEKPSIQPKSGEVLFVMSRTPLWWQLLYPMEKG
jgi:hypothetical protein